jgi:phosphoglycolate/pyridoxal phosphate phosphatase family enzyme
MRSSTKPCPGFATPIPPAALASACSVFAGCRYPAPAPRIAARRTMRSGAPPAMAIAGAGTATPKLTAPAELLSRTKTFIFDCDGVIWRGDSLIPRVGETVEYLRGLGKRVFFVTNNSTKSRAGYLKKFTGLGLEAKAEEIFSSSFAAAAYLEQIEFVKTGKKVYIIGEVGICEELDLIGVPYVGGPDHSDKVPNMASGGMVEHDHDVGAVVVGFDRYINYYKIQNAQLCINENPGCMFIATNLDEVTHLTDAQEWAGNGSMVGAVKGCTGQEPTLVGKPSPLMIDYIVSKYGIQRSEICMVGDRLDTDVLFGNNNGLSSILTLSGVTTEEKLHSPENFIKPDYYVDTIADLMKFA